jgi:hypothetical protein
MKKKLLVTLLATALTLAAGSQAFAALFGDTELIRVAYDPSGSVEWATDLGSVTSLAASTNLTVGGGADAIKVSNITGATSFSDINVAYLAIHNDTLVAANRVSWVSGDPAAAPVSGARVFTPFQSRMGSLVNQYTNSGFTVQGTGSVANNNMSVGGYFFSMDLNSLISAGSFGTLIPAGTNPGGELNLAALATGGSVLQELYAFNGGLATNTKGIGVLSLRTNADGSTTINATATPIPPAFFLMGSGLLGLIGFKRKSSMA